MRPNIKYDIQIDIHNHSIASHHAFNTIEEITSIAEKAGLKGIAITDHHPSLSGDEKYDIKAPDAVYFHVFCIRYKNTNKNVKLYKGIELNLLNSEPWISEVSDVYSDLFDIKIAGIHPFDHLFPKNDNKIKNTDTILESINKGRSRRFHVFAHPIINGVPLDIELIVKACASRRIALELNNAFLLYEKSSIELVQEMLESAASHRCFIALGSDSHVPSEIGLFDNASALLKKINFPYELIVNRTIEALDNFLKETPK